MGEFYPNSDNISVILNADPVSRDQLARVWSFLGCSIILVAAFTSDSDPFKEMRAKSNP